MKARSLSVPVKVGLSFGLALVSLSLALLGRSSSVGERGAEASQGVDIALVRAKIEAGIDSLLERHRSEVEKSTRSTAKRHGAAEVGERPFVERQVHVLSNFSTLEFNRELSFLGSQYGARVQARENTRLRTTTMEVLADDILVETIRIVLQK